MNEMKHFPRLVLPLNTKGLSKEDRLAVLSYNILWTLTYVDPEKCSPTQKLDIEHDVGVTLHELGRYIEHEMNLGGKERFDSADMPEENLF